MPVPLRTPTDVNAKPAPQAAHPPHATALDRRVTVELDDDEGLRTLCGEADGNLRALASRLGIQVLARGRQLHLHGKPGQVHMAADVVSALFARAKTGQDVDIDMVHREVSAVVGVRGRAPLAASGPGARALPRAVAAAEPAPWIDGVRQVSARTPGQHVYLQAIADHDLTFGIGPAGTGKTHLAVACALGALQRREVKRIILTRPAVEAGEQLGFLPGDLREKVSPYLRPLHDAMDQMIDADKVERLIERGQVEAAPLAFMRGRTLDNAFVILDEAQNCTTEQMLMVLTRLGEHTRMVVTGDPDQSDLKRSQPHGLDHALRVLDGIEGIAVVRFGPQDVVRHPLVSRIAQAWRASSQGTVC